MIRHSRLLTVIPFGCLLGLLGCDGTTSPLPVPKPAGYSEAPALRLGSEIRALITTGFPDDPAQAILEHWNIVLHALANEPPRDSSASARVAGIEVEIPQSRQQLVQLVAFIQERTEYATPPAGETQAHLVARLVLYMSLYVYSGENTPVPVVAPGSDVVSKLVLPATTDTVVTPAKHAAVLFPAGAVTQPTVVVITPDSGYYPANCSGPLVTSLCQYPKFYKFNVFPDVRLAIPAKIQVCHVDAGPNRRPLADHDRFRVAHDKPANPADYSPGSTIVDGVEVLALIPMNVTDCAAGDGTRYPPPAFGVLPSEGPLGRITSVAIQLAHRASVSARRLLVPEDAHAIDVGGGGECLIFSTFGVVDPLGTADIVQSTAVDTRFRLRQTEGFAGDTISIPSWSIRNVGSATSGSVSTVVRLASDSLMTTPITTLTIGTTAGLVPQASVTFAPTQFPTPSTLAPGTYFVGTIASPAPPNTPGNGGRVSVRVTVLDPSPDYTMTDLGGLGGHGASAYAINAAGVIVGTSVTSTHTPRGFIWTNGVMSDIGSIGASILDTVVARGINDLGEIVGQSTGSALRRSHAFIRTPSSMRDLGVPPGFASSFAVGINNAGDIVGFTEQLATAPPAAGVMHALRWPARGSIMDLGTLGGTYNAQFWAVNASGQAVGSRDVGAGILATTNVIWSATGPAVPILDLDTPPTPGGGSVVQAINDSGSVVGYSAASLGTTTHAYLYRAGMAAARDLGTIGGSLSFAQGINNRGVVVGRSSIVSNGQWFPFVWNRRAGMVALPVPVGTVRGIASAINQSGVIVGTILVPASEPGLTLVPHAVRWTPAP